MEPPPEFHKGEVKLTEAEIEGLKEWPIDLDRDPPPLPATGKKPSINYSFSGTSCLDIGSGGQTNVQLPLATSDKQGSRSQLVPPTINAFGDHSFSDIGKKDGYGVLSRVSTASTEKSSLTVVGKRSLGSIGTGSLEIEARSLEFNNAKMEASKLLLEQFVQIIPFHVDRVIVSQGIKPYGRGIVDKSSGLPLIIKVVERALRLDEAHESMAESLRAIRSFLSIETLHEVLKFSYDKLEEHDIKSGYNKSEIRGFFSSTPPYLQVHAFGYDRLEKIDLKSCFLYSALTTANKAVSVSSLVDFMIDEGFITGSMPDARKRGREIIKHFIDISFLECTDDGLMVRVHDLLCDMALEILSDVRGSQMLLNRYIKMLKIPLSYLVYCDQRNKSSPSGHIWILKASEGLIEAPSEEEWEEAKMVVLMDNKLSSLPKSPTCSKLLTLFLQRNSCLRTIPPNFFDNMSSLTILNLSKTRIKSLTRSLSKLVCLQVLILRNCERLLYLPSEIGDLNHLKVLDVHGTEICKLPDEIGDLLTLVHLQVCFYGSMDEDEMTMLPPQFISKGLISRLPQLKKLSIIVYPGDKRWTDIALDITTDVRGLDLCSLTFYFPEIVHLDLFIHFSPSWVHGTLTYFNFIVGHDVKRTVSHVSHELEHDYNQQDRCIKFVDGDDIPDVIVEVISRANAFYLDHHLTAHCLTHFGWNRINHLKFCIVKDCPKLEAIFDSRIMMIRCFLFLELLSVHYCSNLWQIWVGPIPAGSLSMLRRLSVHCCPKLEFILSRSMVAVLVKLEELIIEDCKSLKFVIDNENQIAVDSIRDTDSYNANVSVLGLKVLKLHYLTKMENIWNDGGDLPCLEDLSVYNCPRLKKLNLKSRVEETVKKIKVEMAWWRDLEWDDLALPGKLEHCVEEINGDDVWGKK